MRERQTLSDLLRKTFKETAISKRAQARSDVALRIKEILEQSQHGWSLRAMWRVLKDNGEVACAYSTFILRYPQRQELRRALALPQPPRMRLAGGSPG